LAGIPFVPQKEGEVYKRGPKPPPFLWEKGAPANFKIPNLPTEFPFGIWYENIKKIPKGSYRNTESVYNSRLFAPYCPNGRHGHQFWRKKSSCGVVKLLFEVSIQKARNGPSTQLIEAMSCVERTNTTIKAGEHS